MYLFLLLFFACFGSFCACCMYRFIHHEDMLLERSHCPHCNHTLSWWQLIPLVSYLVLQGKCYYCKKKISIYYPLHELLHILMCIILSLFIDNYTTILIVGIYLSINYMLAFIDYKTKLVPTSLLLALFIIIICIQIPTTTNIVTAIFYFTFLTLLSLFMKNQLGYGDVLYISIQSLLFPITHVSFAIVIACTLALLYIIKKRNSHTQIPFIPFLVIGFFIQLFLAFFLL